MTDKNWYLLRNHVYAHDFEAAQTLLEQEPRLISATGGLGETVLHFVAVEDDQEGVAWLFDRGAKLDVKNDFGTPVIFEVAQLGYRELFVWFVANGADVAARDGEGQDLEAYLREYEQEEMILFVSQHMPNKALQRTPSKQGASER